MSGISRRTFLGSALAGGTLLATGAGKRVLAHTATPKRNLFIVVANGGWDTSYALDPKPGLPGVDVPSGQVKSFGNQEIWSDPSRAGVDTFFSAYGAQTAIVRGISVRSIAHPECMKRILTGTASATNPDMGAICAHELGRDLPLPYLVLGDNAFTGPLAVSAARVGLTNQIVALLDPAQAYAPITGAPQTRFVPTAEDESGITAFLQARAEREMAVRGARGYNQARIRDFSESIEKSRSIAQFSGGFGKPGANTKFTAQGKLACDVVVQGIARVVSLDSRFYWDSHATNAEQTKFHNTFFGDLKLVLDDMASRPGSTAGHNLLDESVVVVVSEMGRTPKLNSHAGKDHWPVTSAMVIGSGVKAGRAYGATNDDAWLTPVDFLSGDKTPNGKTLESSSFVAGVVELVGADPTKYFPQTEVFRGFIA